jgi:divalent metal cation (Fe/Co/Zn/Cd) transporter
MDGSLPLTVVHDRATAIEHKLKERFGDYTHVSIHTEPIKNK